MPIIEDVELPSDVVSGTPFDVTVTYTGSGKMDITYSDSFRGKPASVQLAAADSPKTFKMTITRVAGPPPVACRVTFESANTVVKLPRVK